MNHPSNASLSEENKATTPFVRRDEPPVSATRERGADGPAVTRSRRDDRVDDVACLGWGIADALWGGR
jgi:hypothetical protein